MCIFLRQLDEHARGTRQSGQLLGRPQGLKACVSKQEATGDVGIQRQVTELVAHINPVTQEIHSVCWCV